MRNIATRKPVSIKPLIHISLIYHPDNCQNIAYHFFFGGTDVTDEGIHLKGTILLGVKFLNIGCIYVLLRF